MGVQGQSERYSKFKPIWTTVLKKNPWRQQKYQMFRDAIQCDLEASLVNARLARLRRPRLNKIRKITQLKYSIMINATALQVGTGVCETEAGISDHQTSILQLTTSQGCMKPRLTKKPQSKQS